MPSRTLVIRINGIERHVAVQPNRTLLELLREDLRLTGTKHGCDLGECGACTVLVDGRPALSCLTLAAHTDGKEVTTIEGASDVPSAVRLQKSFVEHGAAQCGFCTPGVVLTACALLETVPSPSRAAVSEALGGSLCRCTGYGKIIDAVVAAGRTAETPSP